MNPEIIIHHYPQSPVSEKVRVVLGIKNLSWHSVEIPRLPPKPDLMPLTGGYRMTPVMQIGANIYCDSQQIIREIHRNHPEPTLFPGGSDGMAWGIGRWTDEVLFNIVIKDVLGRNADNTPQEFLDDRIPIYFGSGVTIKELADELFHARDQIRSQFGFMNERIGVGRDFMLGKQPGLPDAFCYYLVWFLRGRDPEGPEILSEFKHLLAWEERVKAIGHGNPIPMDSKKALEIAYASTPVIEEKADPADPRGLKPGDKIAITSHQNPEGGIVQGTLVASSAQEIAIRRQDDQVGEIVVHLPRSGYRIDK